MKYATPTPREVVERLKRNAYYRANDGFELVDQICSDLDILEKAITRLEEYDEIGVKFAVINDKKEQDLHDYEWLKSKLNLTFISSLSDPQDKLKVLEILGVKILL